MVDVSDEWCVDVFLVGVGGSVLTGDWGGERTGTVLWAGDMVCEVSAGG